MLFEPIELDEFSWNLDDCDPNLSEADLTGELHIGDRTSVGLTEQGSIRVSGVEEVIIRQQSFLLDDDNWTKAEVIRWLDQELHRGGQYAGLPASESQAWLNRVVDYLLSERKIDIPIVIRKRHEIADLLFHRLAEHGRKLVRQAAQMLFSDLSERRLVTSLDMPFELAEQYYTPDRQYPGPFNFQKHAFDLIGDMGKEESQCAKKIDDHHNVKRWVRNLEQENAGGFCLPLAPGRFFPDFIVELNDERFAIIEYKGGHLAEGKKELHKKDVGELWAERSGGKYVFRRIVDCNWDELEETLKAIPAS